MEGLVGRSTEYMELDIRCRRYLLMVAQWESNQRLFRGWEVYSNEIGM